MDLSQQVYEENEVAGTLTEVRASTDRIVAAARANLQQLREPSALPNWTRGHVLTHLARGADSRIRLLSSAASHAPIPQYPGPRARAAEIDRGAARPPELVADDFEASADRLLAAVDAFPPHEWSREVQWLGRDSSPARDVLWTRLRELEIHHVDLAWAYGPGQWSDSFLRRALGEAAQRFTLESQATLVARVGADEMTIGTGPVTVRGDARDLLMWLIGRAGADALSLEGASAFPRVPEWN